MANVTPEMRIHIANQLRVVTLIKWKSKLQLFPLNVFKTGAAVGLYWYDCHVWSL